MRLRAKWRSSADASKSSSLSGSSGELFSRPCQACLPSHTDGTSQARPCSACMRWRATAETTVLQPTVRLLLQKSPHPMHGWASQNMIVPRNHSMQVHCAPQSCFSLYVCHRAPTTSHECCNVFSRHGHVSDQFYEKSPLQPVYPPRKLGGGGPSGGSKKPHRRHASSENLQATFETPTTERAGRGAAPELCDDRELCATEAVVWCCI